MHEGSIRTFTEEGEGKWGGGGRGEGRKEGIYAIAPTYAARENREEEKERDVEEEKIGRRESIGRVTGITVWDWAYWRKINEWHWQLLFVFLDLAKCPPIFV